LPVQRSHGNIAVLSGKLVPIITFEIHPQKMRVFTEGQAARSGYRAIIAIFSA